MEDLVEARILPEVPQCPKGGTYNIADGTCSKHNDPKTSRGRKSLCIANQKAIRSACAHYRMVEGKKPKTMTDLTAPQAKMNNKPYLRNTPKCPLGWSVRHTRQVHEAPVNFSLQVVPSFCPIA